MTDEEHAHASIVEAAMDVVAESGYGPASLADIASRADVPPALIEQQYPSKALLISEAVAWVYGDVAHYLGSRIDGAPDGLPKITAYIRSLTAYFYENPARFRALSEAIGSGELIGPPGDQPATRRWQAVADILADGQRKGMLGAFDPRALAIIIGGAIDGLIAESFADPTFDLLEATEELTRLVGSLTRGAVFAP